MAIGEARSWISSRSASDRQRLKIGRCLVIGKAICLSGSKNSYIATLVERHTRYVMLAKVANKETQTVVAALIKQAKKLPNELYKSLTWDRGKELDGSSDGLHWQPTLPCTSAIRKARGSAAPTRTPMACCDSTSRREPTCRCTHKHISTKWRASSMSDHARPWSLKRQQRDLTPVLRRPVEPAAQSGH